jgi:hypothetical protein
MFPMLIFRLRQYNWRFLGFRVFEEGNPQFAATIFPKARTLFYRENILQLHGSSVYVYVQQTRNNMTKDELGS